MKLFFRNALKQAMLALLLAALRLVSVQATTCVDAHHSVCAQGSKNLIDGDVQFSYSYKTEVAFGFEKAIELPKSIESLAKYMNRHLGISRYFDTSFIRGKPERVRNEHLKAKPNKKNVGKLMSIKTEDGYTVRCTYFDRGSDKLVIVGEGFTNEREIMSPFVDMFETDVVLFDFRGQGFEASDWSIDVAKHTFGIDSHHATIGVAEHFDVFAVVDHFRKLKPNQQVFGVSLCYASFIFLKAEGMRPGLFDKIVVDGCWESVPKIIEKIKCDPRLLCVPQAGGWKGSWLWSQTWAQDGLQWLVRNAWNLSIDVKVSLLTYLAKITKTPVMFWYGKDDLMINRSEFEELWNGLACPNKAAVVTSNPHVINHLKQKELYKLLCELFFQYDLPEFRQIVMDPQVLTNYYLNSISSSLKNAMISQDFSS